MKIIIGFGILLLLFAGFQLYISVDTNRTEQQKYEMIERLGKLEIRYYPEAVMASTLTDKNYRSGSRSGFRTLAGYIFGSNDESSKIAMTAPVYMKEDQDHGSMSFVMPEGMSLEDLPKPNNKNVRLHLTEARHVACIQFSGFANDEIIAEKKAQLLSEVEAAGLKYKGAVEYLGYNPPYQVVGRRNEVMVELVDYNQQ